MPARKYIIWFYEFAGFSQTNLFDIVNESGYTIKVSWVCDDDDDDEDVVVNEIAQNEHMLHANSQMK